MLSSVLERHLELKFSGLVQRVAKAEGNGYLRRVMKLEAVVEEVGFASRRMTEKKNGWEVTKGQLLRTSGVGWYVHTGTTWGLGQTSLALRL